MPCASGPAPSAAAASCKVRVALRTNLRALLTVFLTVPSPTSLPLVLELGRCLEVPCCPLSSALKSNTVHCLTKCRHQHCDAVHSNQAHWPPPPRLPTPAQGLHSIGKSAGLASLSLHPVQNAHQLCRVSAGMKQQTEPTCLYPRGAGVLDACFLPLANPATSPVQLVLLLSASEWGYPLRSHMGNHPVY